MNKSPCLMRQPDCPKSTTSTSLLAMLRRILEVVWEDKHMSNLGAIMASEIAETPKVFATILENQQAFDSVKNVLIKEEIQSVLILARGTSDNAAHYLKYLIETQIGLPVGLTSPSSVTVYESELKYSKTLVVAISQSGQSPDLVKFATAARQAGAYLISMTNDDSSPLAQVAHNHFSLLAGPELAVAATKSYNAQLLISYLLVASWTGKKINGQQIISEATRIAATTDLVSKAVAEVSRDREVVILGRGFAYPNAREAALKVQETCKISVQGLSTADYLHGPISALTPETQVFIVAPAHMPAPSITEATTKIRKTSSRIFWIGNGGTPEGNDIVLAGSNCDDEIASTLVDAMVLQRFALEFAVASGYDPDAPVGLSKVTLTN
jgi:glucosamine--fructose-6-phosphate aminotransferase (isomerizing)